MTLANLDLRAGAPVRKLVVEGGRVYSGNVASRFEPATPFTFMPVKVN